MLRGVLCVVLYAVLCNRSRVVRRVVCYVVCVLCCIVRVALSAVLCGDVC